MDPINRHPLYRRHNIDSAMSTVWDFYKNNFISLFIISIAMSLITQLASTMIDLEELQSITDPMLLMEKLGEFLVPILIISVINLFFTTILQHYIIYKPLDGTNNIFVSLYKSLRYFIPFLILMVLLSFFGSIAILLGILALIVGAFFAILYVMTIYLFILPIMMIEGPNIGNTINRTFRLVHKDFWKNIGWVAVFLIILIVISVIFSAVILLPFSGSLVKSIFSSGSTPQPNLATNPLYIILSALVKAIVLPLMPIFACVLYFNARAGEEEVKHEEVIQPDNRPKVEDLYAKPYSEDHPDNPDKKL